MSKFINAAIFALILYFRFIFLYLCTFYGAVSDAT